MKKFRLPRKIKKKLNGIFLYPAYDDGSSLMASPKKYQEDYDAYKSGILRQPFKYTKKQQKVKSKLWDLKYKTPCSMTDKELQDAIKFTFHKDYRKRALDVFRLAKNHPVAIEDYCIFCNAIRLKDSTTACLSLDGAEKGIFKSSRR